LETIFNDTTQLPTGHYKWYRWKEQLNNPLHNQ
jgi:hypothetical protein